MQAAMQQPKEEDDAFGGSMAPATEGGWGAGAFSQQEEPKPVRNPRRSFLHIARPDLFSGGANRRRRRWSGACLRSRSRTTTPRRS